MSAIEYGLSVIMRSVPQELLKQAFQSHAIYGYGNMHSMEELVRINVLNNIVLKDCGLVGGQEITIPLNGMSYKHIDAGYLYVIPLSATAGRHILSVLSVEDSTWNGDHSAIISTARSMNSTGTADAQLVAPNTVLVGEQISWSSAYLRCILSNDENMSNLNPRSFETFGQLCELACKGYIYNKVNISTGDGATTGGTVNSQLRGVLDNYADAYTLYREILNGKWRKIAMMQDRRTHNRLIKMGIPMV